MTQLKPPSREGIQKRVFLAGSIEMGKAVDWQAEMAERLEAQFDDIIILNPRRDDWDSSWVQSIDNPQFNEQVTWEMDMLERADVIALYLAPGTMSPISLLELGLHAKDRKIVACCPKEFWRRGNVEMVCARNGIYLCEDMDEFVQQVCVALEYK